ncbi:MAG: hypothetical protein ACI8ZB_002269 [Desulforhopalus sp.]|jgi:hypothetical protein
MNKRLQIRKDVAKINVHISDGVNLFQGTVKNISDSGLAISDVSPELDSQAELLSITMSLDGRTYRLRAFPRWISEDDHYKTIGVRVISAPRNWYKFVYTL